MASPQKLEAIGKLSQLDISHPFTRQRLELVLALTTDPRQTYTTEAAFALCGHTHSLAHDALAACLYEVRKPHHWYQLPRLYRFDRLARAFIEALLAQHEQGMAEA